MHVAELTDFSIEQINNRRYLYLSSLDIQGAFDTIPHKVLPTALQKADIAPVYRRCIARWLTRKNSR